MRSEKLIDCHKTASKTGVYFSGLHNAMHNNTRLSEGGRRKITELTCQNCLARVREFGFASGSCCGHRMRSFKRTDISNIFRHVEVYTVTNFSLKIKCFLKVPLPEIAILQVVQQCDSGTMGGFLNSATVSVREAKHHQ